MAKKTREGKKHLGFNICIDERLQVRRQALKDGDFAEFVKRSRVIPLLRLVKEAEKMHEQLIEEMRKCNLLASEAHVIPFSVNCIYNVDEKEYGWYGEISGSITYCSRRHLWQSKGTESEQYRSYKMAFLWVLFEMAQILYEGIELPF